ncbi:MAG: periplasmic heavy metal sensor [Pseudomonadota bacterium]
MKGPGLLVGLVVSVALNLFLVGLGVGAWALGPRLMQPPPPVAQGRGRPPLPLWAIGRSLSPEHRPAFNAVLRKALRATAGDIREARALKRRAFDAMAGDTVDAAAVTADLDRARALEFRGRERVEHDVVAFAATLPREERANLAEAMRAAMNQITRRFQNQWEARPRPVPPPPPAPME